MADKLPEIPVVTKQAKMPVQIASVLGQDGLIFESMTGRERLSEPFAFTIRAHATNPDIDPWKMISTILTVHAKKSDDLVRFFSGIITHFTLIESRRNFGLYEIVIEPTFVLGRYTRDYKIYQNKTTLEIIQATLKKIGVMDVTVDVKSAGQKVRDYCVQYGESDFDFATRLMEEEGIFYFFDYGAGQHMMYLGDSAGSFSPAADYPLSMKRLYPEKDPQDQVLSAHLRHVIVPTKHAIGDYNFETPQTKLFQAADSAMEGKGGRIYDFPGTFKTIDDADAILKKRTTRADFGQQILEAKTNCMALTPGFSFTLADHIGTSLNADYTILEVTHTLVQSQTLADMEYQNTTYGFYADYMFVPLLRTPKPRIYGCQTAIVTGKEGEEIWTDTYGRIKVQFYWDQDGKRDENSSCWVRVAQMWAGSGWGALFTPRIGQEVVVSFIDGDPDRPMIVGAVYNGDNKPPYLPDAPTKSTIKSRSSKKDAGFNEIRLEDNKGTEEIYIHAQKDMKTDVLRHYVLNLTTEGDGNKPGNMTITLTEGDQTTTLTKGRQETTLVEGDQITTLKKGARTISVTGGDETHTNDQAFTHTVKKDYALTIDGNLTIVVKGDITIKGSKDITMEATGALTLKSGKAMALKSGAAMTMDAGAALDAKSAADMTLKSSAGLNAKATTALAAEGLSVAIKGQTTATLEGSASTKIASGAAIDIQGSAAVQIKGGVVQAKSLMIP